MEPDHSEEEMPQGAIQDNAIHRLKKIEDQVTGLRRMIEEPKYWVDILQQVAAVQGALTQVAKVVIGDRR